MSYDTCRFRLCPYTCAVFVFRRMYNCCPYFLEKHLSMSGPQTVERGGVDFADACRQTVTGGNCVAATPAINYGKPNHILMTKRARKAVFHNI